MACVSTCLLVSPRLTDSSLIRLRSPVTRYSFSGFPITNRKFPSHGISVVKAATLDKVSGAIRPGGLVESDKLPTDVRKRAMEAVDRCGRRVTVGDVSSRAGLKVTEAQKALQALAADTDGFIEVSDEGDVLYVFPWDYRSKLATKSLRIQIEPFLEKAKGAVDYWTRVSFGTTLIASVVIVFTAIIVILVTSKSYSDPDYYSSRRAREDEGQGMDFIESIFSFVFGDGDPNQGMEKERWQMIGRYITCRGGVVAADELAPYLDVPSSKSDADDESYILPVLLRFDGQPVLDEEVLQILFLKCFSLVIFINSYCLLLREISCIDFRSCNVLLLVLDLVDTWENGLTVLVEKMFKEEKWQFSLTERAAVIGLGAVNLFGVILLKALLNKVAVMPNKFLTFVKIVFPLLEIYAGSFFAIPLVRWLPVKIKNIQIENRNKARLQFARALESPDIALGRKLVSARNMAEKTVIGKERIVYSTDKDMIEQEYEAGEWDREVDKIV